MMQILFVAAEIPTHRQIRSYGLVHALASRGHQISVVGGVSSESYRQITELWGSGVQVIAVPQDRLERQQNMLRGLAGPLPLRAAMIGPRLLEAVGAEVRRGTYDVAHVDGIAASGLAHALTGLPTVLDAGGCTSLALTRRARDGWRQGVRVAFDLARARRYEGTYLASYERVVAASADDAWALQLLGGHTSTPAPAIHVISTPITPRTDSSILTLREQDTLILCTDYESCDSTVEHVVEVIMPLIWRQRAEIRLLVPGPLPRRLSRQGKIDPRILSVSADDVRAIARATIAIAPGSAQSADSALSALSAGTPLIASRAIGRILSASEGRDLLLADEPSELAHAVLELLDDPRYRGQIGRGGRAYAEQQHAPDLVASELEQIYAAARGISIADWNLSVGLSHLHSRELGG
jgi:polysaccharide biosynthesis protein PslH